MYRKVLIAVDGSEISKTVFDRGMELAEKEGSQASVIAVVDTTSMYNFPAANEMSPTFLSAQAEISKQQENTLKAFIADLKKRFDYGFEERIKYGIPHREIISYAKEWDANLLVVGSYGKGGWISEFLFGTTSEKLLRLAKCDVLVVKCKGESE
jgi:nucleotide-binding universal stress UspA family protein